MLYLVEHSAIRRVPIGVFKSDFRVSMPQFIDHYKSIVATTHVNPITSKKNQKRRSEPICKLNSSNGPGFLHLI
jgi:hypothetical protein